ncbi:MULTISPECIES: DNA topoisomerase I [unclassified Schlesneria]|uniref:DNA topoisomerase I n=1 Tax=Schlesneria TaxID=656899 RepID=UPI002F00D94D
MFQILTSRILQPLLKPLTRFFLGFIAIPTFRLLMRKVVRVQEINEELEKDLEQWFRGALLLLVATDNMEGALFGWVSESARSSPYFMAGRLLLAIGVIEGMPDQSLFALIHPGPQKPVIQKGNVIGSLINYIPKLIKGLACQHLNRATPVFAILSVLHSGTLGWVCYSLAIAQYLLIGLVTSKDKALDVLSKFDEAVERQRNEILHEMQHPPADGSKATQPRLPPPNSDIDLLM